MIGDILDGLREAGSKDSEGQFTLAEEHARAKMQRFALADAQRYVLELVQAAVLRGASSLAFTIDADDMIAEFDGAPFSQAELDGLFASLFASGSTPALGGLRKLAIAVNAALGLDTRFARIESGTVTLELRPGEVEGVDSELEAGQPARALTRVHIKRKPSLAVLSDIVVDRLGRLPMELILRARARFAPLAIRLDGREVADGLGGTGGLVEVPLEPVRVTVDGGREGGLALRGSLSVVEGAEAMMVLVKDGVWIESRRLRGAAPGLFVLIVADDFELDVSQARLVDGGRVEAAARAAVDQVWSLVEALGERAASEEATRDEREAAGVALRLFTLHYATLGLVREDPRVAALAARVCWLEACGQEVRWVSLAQLAPRRRFRYVTERCVELSPGEQPTLVLGDRSEAEALQRIFGQGFAGWGLELQSRRRAQANYRRWREQTMAPTLPLDPDVRRVRLTLRRERPPLRAEFGLQIAPDPRGSAARVWLILDGCCMAQRAVQVGISGLWFAAEAPFKAMPRYDGLVANGMLLAVLTELLSALGPALFELVCQDFEAGVERCGEWLLACLSGAGRVQILEAFGFEERGVVELAEAWGMTLSARMRLDASPSSVRAIAKVPLFRRYDGERATLSQLEAQVAKRGLVEFILAGQGRLPGGAKASLLVLSPGQVEVLGALFGPDALRSRVEAFDRRKAYVAHRRAPKTSTAAFVAARGEAEEPVRVAGGGAEGWLWPAYDRPVRAPEWGGVEVSLLREGHALGRCQIHAGCGPLRAVVEHPGLEGDARWESAATDATLAAVVQAVRAAAARYLRREAERWRVDVYRPVEALERFDWRRRALLHALAQGVARNQGLIAGMDTLPLVWSLRPRGSGGHGRELVAARLLMKWIERDGRLVVSRRTEGSRFVPRVVADVGERADLEALFGESLVEAGAMGQQTRVQRRSSVLARLGREDAEPEGKARVERVEPIERVGFDAGFEFGEVGLGAGRGGLAAALSQGLAGVAALSPALRAALHVEVELREVEGGALVIGELGRLVFNRAHPLLARERVGAFELALSLAGSTRALGLGEADARTFIQALAVRSSRGTAAQP